MRFYYPEHGWIRYHLEEIKNRPSMGAKTLLATMVEVESTAELQLILAHFEGLRRVRAWPVRWVGDDAAFIDANLVALLLACG